MDKKEFSPIEIDAIGEISNICLGNSASTLNMLVREKIDITPPRVEIIEKSEYIKEVSSKRVFVKVNYVEGLRGCSILMLEEQDAKAIADLMMGGDGNGTLCADGIGRAAYECSIRSHEPDDGSIRYFTQYYAGA